MYKKETKEIQRT